MTLFLFNYLSEEGNPPPPVDITLSEPNVSGSMFSCLPVKGQSDFIVEAELPTIVNFGLNGWKIDGLFAEKSFGDFSATLNDSGTLWLRRSQHLQEGTYTCEIELSKLPLAEEELNKLKQERVAFKERMEKRGERLKQARKAEKEAERIKKELNDEKLREVEREKQKKRVETSKVQKEIAKQNSAYQKSLRLDKCLLEVFDKFPEQEQSSAEYLCRVTAEFRDNKIMVNCLMDKGMNKKRRLVDAAVNVCVSIAEKPSTMDMLRYGNPLSEYLRMFDSPE